jgi:hypothetical protein
MRATSALAGALLIVYGALNVLAAAAVTIVSGQMRAYDRRAGMNPDMT